MKNHYVVFATSDGSPELVTPGVVSIPDGMDKQTLKKNMLNDHGLDVKFLMPITPDTLESFKELVSIMEECIAT